METQNFSLDLIKELSPNDAKNYITKYFVPLTNGNHALLINGKYGIEKDEIIKKTFFKRISAELYKYYFTEYTKLKTPVYKLNKPIFYDDKINLCSQLPQPKPYDEISESVKTNLKIFTDYIFEVLCSKKLDTYNHLMKWLANMMKGNKNNSAIILKTEGQGVGKSTLPQFIINHTLPKTLTLETGSEPIVSKFNSILGGKLFVSFEEIETFSTGEWLAVSSRLKRMITSGLISLQAKNVDAYEAENINNYFILSNHDCIKDDDGRRYFTLDISTHRKRDEAYWNNIYNNCFNDEVGEAFYSYLHTIDTTGFNPQAFPDTQSKSDGIVKRLDPVYEFLKMSYYYESKPIYKSVGDLHTEYTDYCCSNNKKFSNKIDFNSKLKGIGINHYKSNGKNMYKLSFEELSNLVKKEKWCHELDDKVSVQSELSELELLYKRNAELEKRIAELESLAKAKADMKLDDDEDDDQVLEESDDEEITDLGDFADYL